MKVHWYIPFRGHTGSFCGLPLDANRLTNEPIRVSCLHCLNKMRGEGVITEADYFRATFEQSR